MSDTKSAAAEAAGENKENGLSDQNFEGALPPEMNEADDVVFADAYGLGANRRNSTASGKQSLDGVRKSGESRKHSEDKRRRFSFSKSAKEDDIDDDTYSMEFRLEFDPRAHKFDTVNFHVPHNSANLKQYFPQTSKEESYRYTAVFVLAVIVGILVGCIGWLMEAGVSWATIGLYTVAQTVLIKNGHVVGGIFAFIALGVVMAAGASVLVVFVSPLAAGSGIPEIKSYLNGVKLPGLTKFRTMIAKGVGVCLSIASGYVCGREGPMIHCGGILGNATAQAANNILRARLPYRMWDFFRTEAWKRDFTALGSAAGVAVAFQAPIGGLLFVLEEAATHWSQTMTWATVVGTILACIIGAILEEISHGNLNIDVSEVGFVFGPLSNSSFYLKDYGFFILIGLCGGLFGALLSLLQKPLTQFRFKYVNRPWRRLLEALLVNILTNGVRLLVTALTNECVLVDEAYENAVSLKYKKDFSQFSCPDGYHSPFAALLYNPLDVVLQALLHNENEEAYSAYLLISALAFYTFFTILTYGIAVPSGLFIPAFVWGATLGRLVGLLAYNAFPDHRADFEISSYVYLGGVAGLAGATRMTASVVLIAAESAGFGTGIITGILVAVIAKFTGDFFNTGIYDLHIALKGIPILEPRLLEKPDLFYRVLCRDVMERNVYALYDRSKVSDLVRILKEHKHGCFPVTAKYLEPVGLASDGAFPRVPIVAPEPAGLMNFSNVQFRGMVERRVLVACLYHLTTHYKDDVLYGKPLPRNRYDTAYPNTRYKSREAWILDNVPKELYENEVHLEPYIDRNPAIISDKATVAEAREMFRSTGQRHIICVWLKTGRVVGIMTRKDILPETIEFVDEQVRSVANQPEEAFRFANPRYTSSIASFRPQFVSGFHDFNALE